MTVRTLLRLTAPALFLFATSAFALQQEAGFRARVGDPTGEFGDAVTDPGIGLGAHYGLRPVPGFTFGVGVDFLIYGSETTTYSLPLVEDFDLTTNNYLGTGFLFAQWRPIAGPVQPYAEARLGGNYLWTESKLEDRDFWNDEDVARKTNYDDGALFWGAGGGLLIRLRDCEPEECKPGVLLDFKVLHQRGGEAKYLTRGDIEVVDNVPIYHPTESETDLTSYELGVVLTF
ncbi:porin family protein [bacterium]|nr:porin family protein [bacterium]